MEAPSTRHLPLPPVLDPLDVLLDGSLSFAFRLPMFSFSSLRFVTAASHQQEQFIPNEPNGAKSALASCWDRSCGTVSTIGDVRKDTLRAAAARIAVQQR